MKLQRYSFFFFYIVTEKDGRHQVSHLLSCLCPQQQQEAGVTCSTGLQNQTAAGEVAAATAPQGQGVGGQEPGLLRTTCRPSHFVLQKKGFRNPGDLFSEESPSCREGGVETRGRSPRCRVRRTLKRSVGRSTSWHGLMWSEEKHRRTCTVLAEDRTEDGHWSCQLSCSDSRTLSKLDFLGKDCFFFTSLLLQTVKIMTTTNWCLTLIL